MRYKVAQWRQTSGHGDYIVKYDADLELLPVGAGISVEVISTYPPSADPVRVEETRLCILRGVEAALAGLNNGAVLRLSGLAIHPVDFNPIKLERITTAELRRAIAIPPSS